MSSFLNLKQSDKEYIPLIIDFNHINLDVGFEYFQVLDLGKKFSSIGVVNTFDFPGKDLEDLAGKPVLIDNLWKEPIKDAKFTEIQQLWINSLKQLDVNAIYAGTLSLISSKLKIAKLMAMEKPIDEIFTVWKVCDSYEIASKEIEGFKLPKMSPSGSKTFVPKETELDRILAREKFIL